MNLTRVAYAFVESGGPVPQPTISSVPADIAVYLDEHRHDIYTRAASGRVSEAHFVDANALHRFEVLSTGTDPEFEATAQELAQRLHAGMDARSRRGFFVAATFEDDSATEAMVLKLDASTQKLAAIGGTTAQPVLESVDDLLDIPGELQKGAVFPDPRSHSEVCVGDKNRETSLYFLNAVEVTQHELPGKGLSSFLDVVQNLAPGHIDDVTRKLESVTTRTPADTVLEELSPPLPDDVRTSITGRLASRRRPVQDVDPTAHPARGVIEADGISIRGPAARIRDDVTIEPDPNGDGYLIQIRVSHTPTKRYE